MNVSKHWISAGGNTSVAALAGVIPAINRRVADLVNATPERREQMLAELSTILQPYANLLSALEQLEPGLKSASHARSGVEQMLAAIEAEAPPDGEEIGGAA